MGFNIPEVYTSYFSIYIVACSFFYLFDYCLVIITHYLPFNIFTTLYYIFQAEQTKHNIYALKSLKFCKEHNHNIKFIC